MATPALACETRTLEQVMGPRQEYRIDYPQCGQPVLDAALRQYAEEMAAAEITLREEALADMDDPEDYVQELYASYEIFTDDDRYLSIVFEIWQDGGGAHGYPMAESLLFDLKTSSFITLAQAFRDWPKARAALPGLVRQAYVAQGCDLADLEKNVDFDNLARYDSAPFGHEMHYDGQQFQLSPNGLGLYFDFSSPFLWECRMAFIDKAKLLKIGGKAPFWQP